MLLQNKLLGDPSSPKWVTNLALVGHFWGHFLDHFLVTFWTTFGDHFGAHFRTRSAKEGARWAQEGHQELQRPTKLHFQKSGFRVGLSAFFRSWGLPREPQEAQEGSQEAPKELLNPKKKGSKIDPKINKFWTNFGIKMGPKMDSKTAPKRKKKLTHFFHWFYGCQNHWKGQHHYFDVVQHHFWHPFWNPILGPDLPKKQQDEPKRAIRSFKDQKTAFSKPLKNPQFF